MTDEPAKKCFVICPIGPEGSDIRRWSDDLYKNLIKPIAEEFKYEARRVIDDDRPGNITAHIVKYIFESDLIVADLTGHNPNVFYELALAHAFERPFILLKGDNLSIPFDISQQNVIHLSTDSFGSIDQCRAQLKCHFEAVKENSADFDNPVRRHQEKTRISTEGNPLEKEVELLREDKRTLEYKLEKLASARPSQSDLKNSGLASLLAGLGTERHSQHHFGSLLDEGTLFAPSAPEGREEN